MIQLLMHLFRRVTHDLRKTVVVLLFFLSVFAYATTGFMYFELPAKPDLSWVDSAWWAVVTMTTVGYGDYFPETDGGRLFIGLPTMLLGVSLLGYLLSMLATVLLEHKIRENRGGARMNFHEHIIICHFTGLESVLQLVKELRTDTLTSDAPVVLIDEHLEEIPNELKVENVFYVRGNPAREEVLEQAAFQHCKHLILQADPNDLENTDLRNLTIALTVERLCPQIRTIVHCVHPENVVFFHRAHVDSVICPDALSHQLMVQELQDPGTHDIIYELTSNMSGKQIYVVDVPATVKTAGDARQHFAQDEALFLGVRHNGRNEILPGDEEPLSPGQHAIVIAPRRPK